MTETEETPIVRGKWYEHDEYGTVEVLNIKRRIDAVEGEDVHETIVVEYVLDPESNLTTERDLKEESIGGFREGISDVW